MNTVFFSLLCGYVSLICSENYEDFLSKKEYFIKEKSFDTIRKKYLNQNENTFGIQKKNFEDMVFKKIGSEGEVFGKDFIEYPETDSLYFHFLSEQIINADQFKKISDYFTFGKDLSLDEYTKLRKNKAMIYFLILKLLGVFQNYKKKITNIELFIYFDFFSFTKEGFFKNKSDNRLMEELLIALPQENWDTFFLSEFITPSQKIQFLRYLFFENKKYKEVVHVLCSEKLNASKFFNEFYLYSDFLLLLIQELGKKDNQENKKMISDLINSFYFQMSGYLEMEVILGYSHFLEKIEFFLEHASLTLKNNYFNIVKAYAKYIVRLRKKLQPSISFENIFAKFFATIQSSGLSLDFGDDISFILFTHFFSTYNFTLDYEKIKNEDLLFSSLDFLFDPKKLEWLLNNNHSYFRSLNNEKNKIFHNLKVFLSYNPDLSKVINRYISCLPDLQLVYQPYSKIDMQTTPAEEINKNNLLKKIEGRLSVFDIKTFFEKKKITFPSVNGALIWRVIQIYYFEIESIMKCTEEFLFKKKLNKLFSEDLFIDFLKTYLEFDTKKNSIMANFIFYAIKKEIGKLDLPEDVIKDAVVTILWNYIYEKYTVDYYPDSYFIEHCFKNKFSDFSKNTQKREDSKNWEKNENGIIPEHELSPEKKLIGGYLKSANHLSVGAQCAVIINENVFSKENEEGNPFNKNEEKGENFFPDKEKLSKENNPSNLSTEMESPIQEGEETKNEEKVCGQEAPEEVDKKSDKSQLFDKKKAPKEEIEQEKKELNLEKILLLIKKIKLLQQNHSLKSSFRVLKKNLQNEKNSWNDEDDFFLRELFDLKEQDEKSENLKKENENNVFDLNKIEQLSTKNKSSNDLFFDHCFLAISSVPLFFSFLLEGGARVAQGAESEKHGTSFVKRISHKISNWVDLISNKSSSKKSNSLIYHKKIFSLGFGLTAAAGIVLCKKPKWYSDWKNNLIQYLKS